MPDPYLGEIRPFAFGFVPSPGTGWAACNGSLLDIRTHSALYALLGTRYGGDGITKFGLPDLRGRVAMGAGPVHPLAQAGGEDQHVLTEAETPVHAHALNGAEGDPDLQGTSASGGLLATVEGAYGTLPGPGPNLTSLAPASLVEAGASAGHENRMPSLALNYCIATSGIWPTRS